jgi:hypothetical protein
MTWPALPPPPANRSDMVAPVNTLADRLELLLADELRGVDREVARSALLTLAHRLQPAPPAHRCKRTRESIARPPGGFMPEAK